MAELLLDTDVVIDSLRGARDLDLPGEAAYSVITRCELFAGQGQDESVLRALLGSFEEVAVDRRLAEFGGRLRRDHPQLKTPDALIAATAIAHDLALLTRNRRHFEPVPGLRLQAP